jgi:hypothetical protein
MLRFVAATVVLLGACTSGPPSRSESDIVRRDAAAHGWRASGQLLAQLTAYDAEKDRFFVATRDGSTGPVTPRLFDVATGRITDLSFECPDHQSVKTVEPGGSMRRWGPSLGDFGNPRSGAVFLPDDRIAYACPEIGIPFPAPDNGEDIAIGMIFVDQPLSAGGAPRNTRIITRHTDPPWGVTFLRALPGGGWITQRMDTADPNWRLLEPVIALSGAAQFERAAFAEDVCPPPSPEDWPGRKCRALIVGGAPDGRLFALLQVPRRNASGQGFNFDLDAYLLLRAEGTTLHVDGKLDTSGQLSLHEPLESAGGWIAFRDSDYSRPTQEDVAPVVLHLWNPATQARIRIYTPPTEAFDRYVIYSAAVSPSGQTVAILAGRQGPSAMNVFVIPIPQASGYHMISLTDAPFAKSVGHTNDIRITRGGRIYTFNASGIDYHGTVK